MKDNQFELNQHMMDDLDELIKRDYSNMAGMVIRKDGEIVCEKYYRGCDADSRVHIYSVTKSIVSLLIGIALDQGHIKSINQNVLDFFPHYTVKKREKTIQNITLRDLLTMTAPYKYRFAPYIKYFTSDNYVDFTLDLLGGRGQIGTFRYTPLIGPDILSGILMNTTGDSVFDFASRHLFAPLDITVENSIVFQSKEEQMAFNSAKDISGWAADETGINTGGWGLTLSPLDMAKIGQLYLNNGMWNGKQIVSEQWIRESTREQSHWEKAHLSYGYLWWVLDDKEQIFAAMGDGGNVIYVNRTKNLVISIASFFAQKPKDRIELIQKYIEPCFENTYHTPYT